MEETPARTAAFDAEPDGVNQPGLSQLREAVENHLKRRLPSRGSLRQDGIAGLNSAISSVPDGMASGILVGVNPIYGLYACMVGQVVRTGKLRLTGPVRAYEATPVRGQSTQEAVADARTWLVGKGADASPDDASSPTRDND